MTKQQKELIATGVLLVSLFIVIAISLKPKKSRRKSIPEIKKSEIKVEPLVLPPKEGKIRSPVPGDYAVAQKERTMLKWGIDPFYHLMKKEILQSSMLVLKGISIGEGKRGYAFINDEIVSLGDIIADYKVMEVQKNRVLLKKGTESFYLVLPEE